MFFRCSGHRWLLSVKKVFPPSNSRTLTLWSDDLFAGSDGFLFAASSEKFSFRQVLRGPRRRASPLRFSRCNRLVGVFNEVGSELPRIIVAGGVKSVGGLVDIEERPAVEIYNPCSDKWEPCPPLPAEFSTRSSSQSLCSALFKRKLYVLGIHCFISSFNLDNRSWSGVQTLRPPGALCCFISSFLLLFYYYLLQVDQSIHSVGESHMYTLEQLMRASAELLGRGAPSPTLPPSSGTVNSP